MIVSDTFINGSLGHSVDSNGSPGHSAHGKHVTTCLLKLQLLFFEKARTVTLLESFCLLNVNDTPSFFAKKIFSDKKGNLSQGHSVGFPC